MALGVTDSGLTSAAFVANVAATAVAVINTAAALDIARDQEKLAKDYLRISQEQNQYYYDVYVPCEDAEIREACSRPLYTPHEDTTIGRSVVSARNISAGSLKVPCLDRYNTGRNAAIIKDQVLAEAGSVALAANLGRRIEEDYGEAMDDLRWARRSAALSRGRGMMAQTVSFSGFAMGLFGKLGEQAAQGAAGAIGYLAYSANRGQPGRAPRPVSTPHHIMPTPVQTPTIDYRQENINRRMNQSFIKGSPGAAMTEQDLKNMLRK